MIIFLSTSCSVDSLDSTSFSGALNPLSASSESPHFLVDQTIQETKCENQEVGNPAVDILEAILHNLTLWSLLHLSSGEVAELRGSV